MSITPNDPHLADNAPITCSCCANALSANTQAITYHFLWDDSGPALVLCRRCAAPVIGSLLQDFAKVSYEWFHNVSQNSAERAAEAARKVAKSFDEAADISNSVGQFRAVSKLK